LLEYCNIDHSSRSHPRATYRITRNKSLTDKLFEKNTVSLQFRSRKIQIVEGCEYRKFMHKLASIATSAAIACGTLYSLPSQAATLGIDQIFAFGDSLTDEGNAYSLTGGLFPPDPFYAQRLSNGRLWIEYLAEDLGLDPAPFFAPTQGKLTDGINFAFAGSTTGTANTVVTGLPGLQTQVGAFLNFKATTPAYQFSPDALYVIWGGANNYLPTQSPDFVPFTTPDETVDNLIAAISTLMAAGAKNFLVPNLPDLGKLPLTNGSPIAEPLNQLTRDHNDLLAQRLDQLSQTAGSDSKIIYADFNGLFNQVLADPAQFGLSNVTAPCLFTGCTTPDEYFFWDQIHPTTKTHEILGNYAYQQLKSASEPPVSVPEPGVTLGLMAVGAIGLGRKLRRAA
jgi:phospholipase/lecithinase/hemolysin